MDSVTNKNENQSLQNPLSKKETKKKLITKKSEALSEVVSKGEEKDTSSVSNNNGGVTKRSVREKKPTSFDDLGYIDKEKLKNSKNSILFEVFKKCEKGMNKLKKHPLAEYYLNSTSPEIPSLSQVEKNLKAYGYPNTFQFTLDLRKIWNYYFSHFSSQPEVYQRTCKMSEFSEEVIKEIESSNENKTDIHELSKKLDKLTREMKEIQGKGANPGTSIKTKGPDRNISIMEKPMTISEKNSLGNNIRSLNPDQLKGIVSILSDSMVIDQKSKFFEFDIETLGTRKLRELEKYVKSCLKAKTGNNSSTAYKPIDNKNLKKAGSIGGNTGELTENAKIEQLKVI